MADDVRKVDDTAHLVAPILLAFDRDPEILGPVFADAGITDKVSVVWERVAEFEPDAPYWYLRQIGIDPILQHGGHGSRLLAAGLHEIDGSGGVACLEATNGAARAFYERHRFTTLGEISANGSPPLWPMVRTPA